MRTTLELDARVLAAARARVYERRSVSIGAAISEFALKGLAVESSAPPATSGLVLLPTVPGHMITDEMVAEALNSE
ncbi:MAG: antitoxin [Micrococcales bacterium]|nr:antitoxin [Micrococcales bacterium]